MQLIPGNSIAKLKLRLFCSPQQQFIMRTHPRLSSSWALRPLLPLAVVSALLGREITPADLRRNIAVSGINLFSLKGRRFRIGRALLETTGWCQPCARLEQRLGPGTFQAMRGHGGITARVIEGGIIRLDDEVRVEPA